MGISIEVSIEVKNILDVAVIVCYSLVYKILLHFNAIKCNWRNCRKGI